jgi:hypothetical protein
MLMLTQEGANADMLIIILFYAIFFVKILIFNSVPAFKWAINKFDGSINIFQKLGRFEYWPN